MRLFMLLPHPSVKQRVTRKRALPSCTPETQQRDQQWVILHKVPGWLLSTNAQTDQPGPAAARRQARVRRRHTSRRLPLPLLPQVQARARAQRPVGARRLLRSRVLVSRAQRRAGGARGAALAEVVTVPGVVLC